MNIEGVRTVKVTTPVRTDHAHTVMKLSIPTTLRAHTNHQAEQMVSIDDIICNGYAWIIDSLPCFAVSMNSIELLRVYKAERICKFG